MWTVCEVALLIAGFGSCVGSVAHNYRPLSYQVPKPLIRAFRPRGLEVSIPHTTGIQLFAFHANINKPLEGTEDGLVAQNIRQREGEKWVFHNSSVRLRVGDKLHYWVFVVKDNLGYKMLNEDHEITELLPLENKEHSSPTTVTTPRTEQGVCSNVVLNLAQNLTNLEHEIHSVREDNHILVNLIKDNEDISKTVALADEEKVGDDDLISLVQTVLRDKLQLSLKAENVRPDKGLIKFRVKNLEEKLAVIKAAKRRLKSSRFKIIY